MKLYRINAEKPKGKLSKREEAYIRANRATPPLKVDQTYFIEALTIADAYAIFSGKGHRGRLVDVREALGEECAAFRSGQFKSRKSVDYRHPLIHRYSTRELPQKSHIQPQISYRQQEQPILR